MKKEEKSMNICIVNAGFGLGGVERVAIELANSFQRQGNNVSLVDFSGKNIFFYETDTNINTPHVINSRKLHRKIIKRALYFKYRLDKKTIKLMDIYKEQAKDLIKYLKEHTPDVLVLCQDVLTGLIPLLKKEVEGLKVVAWQHNSYEVYINKYCKEFLSDYLLGVKAADLVVCLTADDLEKFKKINVNSCYIYNPLTISGDKISNLTNKSIVFVGRLAMQQKGLDYLIPIAKNIPSDWKILVGGEGTDKDKFKNLIDSNNLQDKIILRGSLKGEELINFYSEGSIFISTSRWEGFGLVVTEAMACGLPVISFDNLGPKEILENGEYGILVEDYDVNKIILNLNDLIKDKEKRERFQNKSIKRAKDFSIEVILEEWNEKLSSL
ncbi:glycosyl transferase family 1 [Priestia megaterium]|nr:glycosyl transferase family 1 [Priestia megaterium]